MVEPAFRFGIQLSGGSDKDPRKSPDSRPSGSLATATADRVKRDGTLVFGRRSGKRLPRRATMLAGGGQTVGDSMVGT